MESTKSLEDLLSKLEDMTSVKDAVLMTKTGMFVLGNLRKSSNLDNFVAMSAILMGSAEATSMEFNEPVKRVVIQTKNSKIAITNVTDEIVLAVDITGEKTDEEIFEELDKLISPFSED